MDKAMIRVKRKTRSGLWDVWRMGQLLIVLLLLIAQNDHGSWV